MREPPSHRPGNARAAIHPTSIYPRLLEGAWEAVSESVREAHFDGREVHLEGDLDLEVGRGLLARLLRRLLGLPRVAGRVRAALEIAGDWREERWFRTLGSWRLLTVQSCGGGLLCERFGPLELRFALFPSGGGLRYRQRAARLRLGGLAFPLPRRLAPAVAAREMPGKERGTTRIHVRLGAPLAGFLLSYRGLLRRPG